MSGHSPAPWVIHTRPGMTKEDPQMDIISNGLVVCRMGVFFTNCAHRDAANNARLIAAAPEMLTALSAMLELVEDMTRFVGTMSLRDYALLNSAPIAARRAIAAARGEREIMA